MRGRSLVSSVLLIYSFEFGSLVQFYFIFDEKYDQQLASNLNDSDGSYFLL